MKRRLLLTGVLLSLLLAAVSPAMAFTGGSSNWSESELTQKVGVLDDLIDVTNRPQVKDFMENVRDDANTVLAATTISDEDGLATKRALLYAIKLGTDVNAGDPELWEDSPFVIYDVPALSPEKRMPYTLPNDGELSGEIAVVSAQDEYEAASFVMAPLSDANAVTFTVSALQGEDGSIPASAVDLRVVKTWYQGGTAWQSYFFDDTKDVLTPELLLHDETLVQVDHVNKRNAVRVDYPSGSQYVDVSGSPPAAFSSYDKPVADSAALQPISLEEGESKQMWITTKVPAGTAEGVYTGTIAITADGVPAGELTLKIRVLPFELPDPKTYYDLNKDFYVMSYHSSTLKNALAGTGGNTALAETRLLNQYRNLVEHNVVNLPTNAQYDVNQPQVYLRQLELMEEAGMDLNPLFGVGPAFPSNEDYSKFSSYLIAKKNYEANPTEANRIDMENKYAIYWNTLTPAKNYVQAAFNAVTAAVGHTNVYFDGWDEAEWNRLLWQQEVWRFAKEDVGAKIFATGHGDHLNLPIKEDFLSWAGEPKRANSGSWHALGSDKIITNYAYPHTGPENPDLMRQRHGMWMYKANYDAVYNYIWYFESQYVNPWSEYIDATFRAFNFVYPTKTDVIDTLAWEGFREGIDDIRYATKLKQLAAEAVASAESPRVAAANKALAWLEAVNERSTNSDLIRAEMIHQILKLLDLAAAE